MNDYIRRVAFKGDEDVIIDYKSFAKKEEK